MTDFLVLATVWNLGMPLRGTPLELEIREFQPWTQTFLSHNHLRIFCRIVYHFNIYMED